MSVKEFILKNLENYKFRLIKFKEIDKKLLNLLRKRKPQASSFKNSLKDIHQKDLYNFIFILRVLDFMLWKHPKNWEYKNKKGFWGLLERTKILFKNNYQKINFEKFKKIISPKEDINLSKLRYKLFKKSLDWLKNNFDNNFTNYFEENKEPIKFVLNLLELNKFKDYHKNFYFLKPNQLLYYEIGIIDKCFKLDPYLEHLTVFPDNKLPRIFLSFGIIELPKNYLNKIKKGEIIKSRSLLENELRIATILIAEELSRILKIPHYIVDDLLWHLPDRLLKFPKIKVKTIFY